MSQFGNFFFKMKFVKQENVNIGTRVLQEFEALLLRNQSIHNYVTLQSNEQLSSIQDFTSITVIRRTNSKEINFLFFSKVLNLVNCKLTSVSNQMKDFQNLLVLDLSDNYLTEFLFFFFTIVRINFVLFV